MLLCNDDTGRIFFQLLRLVFCEKEIPKIAGHSQKQVKYDLFERGYRWFEVFFIGFQLFSIQNHPCYGAVLYTILAISYMSVFYWKKTCYLFLVQDRNMYILYKIIVKNNTPSPFAILVVIFQNPDNINHKW
jgi:hypothetical protein